MMMVVAKSGAGRAQLAVVAAATAAGSTCSNRFLPVHAVCMYVFVCVCV